MFFVIQCTTSYVLEIIAICTIYSFIQCKDQNYRHKQNLYVQITTDGMQYTASSMHRSTVDICNTLLHQCTDLQQTYAIHCFINAQIYSTHMQYTTSSLQRHSVSIHNALLINAHIYSRCIQCTTSSMHRSTVDVYNALLHQYTDLQQMYAMHSFINTQIYRRCTQCTTSSTYRSRVNEFVV